eukprot:TRINITY_DN1698_c0_g1_i10.p1 TRINITY_DN1698_c0_g1~~TRINITY_DN1698_c0_g1_i10.p1  ORF type:complete len:421 (-),score=67.45 TRINITY_DN1698_c0_g1_i10:84-1346(-)
MQVEKIEISTRTPPVSPLKRASKRRHLMDDSLGDVMMKFKDKKGEKHTWSLPFDFLTRFDRSLPLCFRKKSPTNYKLVCTNEELNREKLDKFFDAILKEKHQNLQDLSESYNTAFILGCSLAKENLGKKLEAIGREGVVTLLKLALAHRNNLEATRLRDLITLDTLYFQEDTIRLLNPEAFRFLTDANWWINCTEDDLLSFCLILNQSGAMIPLIRFEALSWEVIRRHWKLFKEHKTWFSEGLERRIKDNNLLKAKDRNDFPTITINTPHLTMAMKKYVWEEYLLPRDSTWEPFDVAANEITDKTSDLLLLLFSIDQQEPKLVTIFLLDHAIQSFYTEDAEEIAVFEPGEESFVGFVHHPAKLLLLTDTKFAFIRSKGILRLHSPEQDIEVSFRHTTVNFKGAQVTFCARVQIQAFVRTS